MSRSLTLRHDRVIYLLKDTPANRRLIHRYIDVYEYPDGRIELRADCHPRYGSYRRAHSSLVGQRTSYSKLGDVDG